MEQASATFTVEEFEYVEAGPGLALLRLAGTWRAGAPALAVPLVAVTPDERLTLSALPAPPAGGDAWRAAYSAEPALLRDPAVTFELEPPAGGPIELPRPVEHGAALPEGPEPEAPEPAAPAPPLPAATAVDRPVSRIFGRLRQPPVPESHAALKDALAAERHARQAAERSAAEERARAQRAEAVLADELRTTVGKTEELISRIGDYEDVRHELAAAHEEIDAANDHIDTLNEAHSLELGAARSQRDTAERQKATLAEQLVRSRAEADALRERLEDREALIEHARAELDHASAETADLQAAVTLLRDAIAARVRNDAAARGRFTRDPAALDRSRDELRRDAERIAQLERQAEALRDAIHSQLPYSLHASPLQEALPLPDAEQAQSEA